MTSVGEDLTSIIGSVGDVAAEIVGEPLLLLACVGLPLAGVGITFFKRLLRSRV